jgi:FkbM family methyltransferase
MEMIKSRLKTLVPALVRRAARDLILRTGYHFVASHNVPQLTFLGIGHHAVNTIIDVGANRGQFARRAREWFPNAVIHCFEPLPAAAEELYQWADRQKTKVNVHKIAIGAESGKAMMWHHIDHDFSSSFLRATVNTDDLFPQTRRRDQVEVTVSTLDEIFINELATGFDGLLVKLDVQGFEQQVIAGGRKIFGVSDIVILEISVRQLYYGQPEFAQIVAELSELGLFYVGNLDQQHDALGQPIYLDATFARRFPFAGERMITVPG